MGCNNSKADIVAENDGDGKDFFDRFSVGEILGQGEFGVVKSVYDKNDPAGAGAHPYACKILRKGMAFKDNTIYSAIKPKVLKLECEILRTLAGKHYNVKLQALYESNSAIYIVTDLCAGGDMFHYVADIYGGEGDKGEDNGLRTEDVSRISFQLLDAVCHCAKYGIIHRDIKPENIMFKEAKKGSPLQLIDFGSGTMTTDDLVKLDSNPQPCEQADGSMLDQLTTFAGSAFYISPEMFQKKYTCKTDMWSAGVVLYVLVAGYPTMELQDAFNMLQSSKAKKDSERIEELKALPHMPEMPDTFLELLAKCLTYRHKERSNATDILDAEFVRFHHEHEMQEEEDRTTSKLVQGAAMRHIQNRLYAIYERGLTALLVSILKRSELKELLTGIDDVVSASPENHLEMGNVTNKKRLQIIRIYELVHILQCMKIDTDKEQLFHMISELAHGKDYSQHAYHIAILRQFYTFEEGDDNDLTPEQKPSELDNSRSRKLKSVMSKRGGVDPGDHSGGSDKNDEFNPHLHSAHGGNYWDTIKKQMGGKNEAGRTSMTRIVSAGNLRGDELNSSSHL